MSIKGCLPGFKRCPECRRVLPFGEFAKHRGRKFGIGMYCKPCNAKRARDYRKDNPEWREWRRKYYYDNIEVERARGKARYRKHREKYREWNRLYHESRKEHRRALTKRWREENPDKWKACQSRRRARKMNAEGHFSPAEWEALCQKHNHRCLRCGMSPPEIKLTPDHVVPLSKGGTNYIDNIQPLCFDCNRRKSAQMIDYRTEAMR